MNRHACTHCGWSPTSRPSWCDLGCGRDYNQMVELPASVVRQLKVLAEIASLGDDRADDPLYTRDEAPA